MDDSHPDRPQVTEAASPRTGVLVDAEAVEILRHLKAKRQRQAMARLGQAALSWTRAVTPPSTGPDASVLEGVWADIVGARLAQVTEPIDLLLTKSGYVLTLRVAGAAGLMIQHAETQIRDKVSQFLGHPRVARVKYVQGALRRPPSLAKIPPPAAVPDDLREIVDRIVADVVDLELREALRGLGEGIYMRSRTMNGDP